MKFNISTAGRFYTNEESRRLKKLGFKFDDNGYDKRKCKRILSEDIELDISSLDDLMKFSDKWGDLIISRERIIIYDDYCE